MAPRGPFLHYYKKTDVFTSPEGILKMVSLMGCIGASLLFVYGRRCGEISELSAAGPPATGALLAALVALSALGLTRRAPQLALYTDLVVTVGAGVVLLVAGALSLALCTTRYVHGWLLIMISCGVLASAALTYSAVMRLWDATARPSREPSTRTPHELEV